MQSEINSKKIIFRVDASLQIGSGHVMRCLTLAKSLRDSGQSVSFICRSLSGNLNKLIYDSGFEVFELTTNNDSYEKIYDIKQLPKNKQIADAEQTISILTKSSIKADWLVLDNYGFDQVWENKVKNYTKKIMVIDDLANRHHSCDILLDQSLPSDQANSYQNLLPTSCIQLLGPKFALLREQFKVERCKLRKRDGSISRIFVFFGGADCLNMTRLTLDAILNLKKPELQIDVVVGKQNKHINELQNYCSNFAQINFHCQVDNIAKLMQNADLAIGAGGSTSWERCCLGLPSIVCSMADNQDKIVNILAKAKVAKSLGKAKNIKVSDIKRQLNALLTDQDGMLQMSKNCIKLVDAQGTGRVKKELLCL
ncbi:MAG: UDP-2,4-diacetamido-2,4,6-trideoxy-beta-L-altropyranose hydrolase [Gammaproteobacteria bacterium]|nr:UDP-2,4-diacetamido-2,4,6-trideoxy-beta-L-altropyranose hydrolase [Gammaproteobacteria bacterium]